ncbi:very short patch repair endonuclease [Tropicimonas sp. IMCC34011]|uniref:very short patch repair endonuclease n=1 Tax=Tropicimonas sp. IMCC34011 TaxID=2248759 RepID=UPI000E26B27E|nr:very short patch repair endonuclease [Tropicimonas sp. IMCC34011]
MDTRSPEQRRRIMQSVKQKDTAPEMVVRRLLHAAGYRYRLHRKDMPGRPDIVFGGRRKVIFVHGCFWHAHGCSKGQAPKSKLNYWGPKLAQNAERDARNVRSLEEAGWQVLTVWECETKEPERLLPVLRDFVDK